MDQKQIQRNIKLYYLFELFREPLFWGPIIILFIQRVSGMSLSEIYVMEAVVIATLILLEIPSGALADIIGRKKTIFLGTLFLAFDTFLFSISNCPLMIWISNFIWAIGFSLISGADSSLLYDSLLFLKRDGEYKKIQGRAMSVRLFLVAFCSIFVGYLAEINIRIPALISVIPVAFNCLIAFFMIEPPVSKRGKYSLKKHWDMAKLSILFVANHKGIKWIIAFVSLIVVSGKLWFFTYNPYFELVEFPLKYFGLVFFCLNIVAGIFSFSADWIYKKQGDMGSIILMISCLAFPIILMGSFPTKSIVILVVFQNIARGYINPFSEHFIHSYIESKNRATVVSIKSAVVSFFQAIMLFVLGIMLKITSLATSLNILGYFILIVGLMLIFYYLKIFKSSKR